MTQAERIADLAESQIGMVEFPPKSNNVVYNTAYYGGAVKGSQFDWCAVFVWWLFDKLGLSHLYYDGKKTAYVPTLADWGRRKKLLVDDLKLGDLVCFDFKGKGSPGHVGVCVGSDNNNVLTIDGNTGTGDESNGGAVMLRKRNKKYIYCIIRPEYEEDETLTQNQFNAMMDVYIKNLSAKEPSDWSAEAREWAEKRGIIAGDEHGNKQYKKFCTREELIQILYNKEH